MRKFDTLIINSHCSALSPKEVKVMFDWVETLDIETFYFQNMYMDRQTLERFLGLKVPTKYLCQFDNVQFLKNCNDPI